MSRVKAFLKRKNIEITAKRYGIDALSAMAQGLFASLDGNDPFNARRAGWNRAACHNRRICESGDWCSDGGGNWTCLTGTATCIVLTGSSGNGGKRIGGGWSGRTACGSDRNDFCSRIR